MRAATNAEVDRFQHGDCPFCPSRQFREGPSGGLASNWFCEGCGAVLNVASVLDGQTWPILFEIIAEPTNTARAVISAGSDVAQRAPGASDPSFAELMPARDRPRPWR